MFFGVQSIQAQGDGVLPTIFVEALNGDKVDISDHGANGKLTIISFWATWCSPCKRELDAIAVLYPEWQEKYDVELLAISTDDSRSIPKVGPMVEQRGWEYQIYVDRKGELKNALQFQTVPHTFLIDQKGSIVFSHSGYIDGDEYELEEKLEALSTK